MNIFQINSVPYGSTGKIMFSLADILEKDEHNVSCTSGFSWKRCERDDYFITSGILEKEIHTVLAKFTGYNGCFSNLATQKLINELDKFSPSVIHLHNIHGWYLNLPIMFKYIKQKKVPIIWTLHDCWSFTGQCAHFTAVSCERWRTGCGGCPQLRRYPQSYVDRSRRLYQLKIKWFTGVQNLTIVTPSQWLVDLVKQSFLKDYPVRVIPNGIDLDVFKPTISDFRIKYSCRDRFIILGVAFGWDARKGLDVFIELADRLKDHYQIVLVGTDEKIDKKLPPNIISIHRTQNQQELAEIYTVADVFVNPTREDNFPTVNLESLACGTPVITFNTGGSPECIDDTCGSVVPCGDIDGLEAEIVRVCTEKPYSAEACMQRARMFDKNTRFQEYIDLYEEVIG